jgi:glycosyltransferase involved in cell wall biosynthesis
MHKSKLRTLFILRDFCCGGPSRATVDLLRHLDRSRFEPTLFFLERKGIYFSEVSRNIKVVFAHKSPKYNRYLMPYYLAKLVAEARQSDVVVGVLERGPTYLAYLAAALTGKPVIGWINVPLDEGLQWASNLHLIKLKMFYPRLTRVVCVSQSVKQSILKMAPVKPERLKVIYCHHDLISIIEKAKESLTDWAVDIFKKPTLIAVGRLSWEKGFDILISAHAKVLKSGIGHNLIIVGDGPHRVKLQELVRQWGIADSVFMPGYISNPYPLIKKASALVLSSRFEGLPGVVIEALALGKPVVATACGGPVEILSDGRAGVLVPPEDVNALADGMSRILSDRSLRDKLSTSDIERMRCFSTENIIPQWEQLLMEVSGQ